MPAMARESRRDIGPDAPRPAATAGLDRARAGGHLDDRRMTPGGERASRPHTIRACLTRERHWGVPLHGQGIQRLDVLLSQPVADAGDDVWEAMSFIIGPAGTGGGGKGACPLADDANPASSAGSDAGAGRTWDGAIGGDLRGVYELAQPTSRPSGPAWEALRPRIQPIPRLASRDVCCEPRGGACRGRLAACWLRASGILDLVAGLSLGSAAQPWH